MAIMNYTTSIKAEKTIGEIQVILSKHGAQSIMIGYDNGLPVRLEFSIKVNDQFVNFRLPSKHDGVLRAMKNDRNVPRRLCEDAQALKVSWRIIKVWIQSQMALVEAELAELPEIFLPYATTSDGTTFYKRIRAKQFLLD